LIQFPFIDTFILARQYFNFDSNALGNIADAVGIEVNVKHRAMADVLTMLAVSKYLFSNMFRKGINEIKPKITNFNPSVFPNTIS
jgi:DNA polymerase-3 subunit epsilon